MWQASDRFFATIVRRHIQRSKVEVLIDGQVAFTIYGVQVVDQDTGARAASIDATVNVRRAFVRRQATASILDVDGLLTPSDAKDAFAVLRNEIRLYVGVQFWDATPAELADPRGADGPAYEWIPIFTGPIGRAQVNYPLIQLECYDRLWDLRGRFTKTYQIASGKNVIDQLEVLLRSIIPQARQNIRLPDSDFTTALTIWDSQKDQSEAANELATAAGVILFSQPDGLITATPESVADPRYVVWTYRDDTLSTMGEPSEDIDGTQAENAVLATNEVDGVVGSVAGYAEDTNPASLTYVGVVPRIVRFYSSPQLKTNAQAAAAARTIMLRELGVADTVVLPIFGNPAHESGDVVQISATRAGIEKIVIVDEFDVSTRAANSNQALSCRTQVI